VLAVLLVEYSQTQLGAVILQLGKAFTVTFLLHVAVQLLVSVTVTFSVTGLVSPADQVMLYAVVAEVIFPLVMVQL